MIKKILLVILCFIPSLSIAATSYSIKEMTPQVKQALESRKDRYSQIRALKSSGSIGETSRGYLKVLSSQGNAEEIVSAENIDRKTVYMAIASQNGLEGGLSTIESAFAQVQREKAESGDKIQLEDGSWTVK